MTLLFCMLQKYGLRCDSVFLITCTIMKNTQNPKLKIQQSLKLLFRLPKHLAKYFYRKIVILRMKLYINTVYNIISLFKQYFYKPMNKIEILILVIQGTFLLLHKSPLVMVMMYFSIHMKYSWTSLHS